MSLQLKLQSNLTAWKTSIENAERIKHTVAGNLKLKNDLGKEAFEELLKDADYWRTLVNEFFVSKVLKRIQDEFRAKSQSRDFWPKILRGSKGFDSQSDDEEARGKGKSGDVLDDALQDQTLAGAKNYVGSSSITSNLEKYGGEGVMTVPVWAEQNIARGFPALWEAMSQTRIELDSTTITLGMGPMKDVLALRMNQFMPIPGSIQSEKELNTWFYGVEYGTGIAENVGSKWVRKSGKTKDKDPPGSWWVPRVGVGAQFTGQKGMHLFYDESTRLPKQFWRDFIDQEWAKFMEERLTSGTIGWGS